jgi:hypothetical protein
MNAVEPVGFFKDSGDVRHLEHLDVLGTVRLVSPGSNP